LLAVLQNPSFVAYDVEYEKQLILSALLPLVQKYTEEVGVIDEKKAAKGET
jgi:hypothetical protein